jgi:hypothetical protein
MDMNNKKELSFKLLSLTAGIILALLIGEIFIRVFHDFSHLDQPNDLLHKNIYAQCYPTDPYDNFPLDLRNETDEKLFRKRLPSFRVLLPLASKPEQLNDIDKTEVFDIGFLIKNLPHCVVYDISPASPRRLTLPKNYDKSVGLIGDSFAAGIGLSDENTFGYKLAARMNWRVINLSQPGSNIQHITEQFEKLVNVSGSYDISTIFYLFVLNDPLITMELSSRQKYINDLMAIRRENIANNAGFVMMNILRICKYSKAVQFLLEKAVLYTAKKKTIEWYRDIYDEEKNEFLIETFNIIGRMNVLARQRDVDLVFVIYPILADLDDYPFRKVHEKIRDEVTKRGVRIIDLLPVFEEHSDKVLIFHPSDIHPNGFSHEIAVEHIGEVIDRGK